MYQDSGHVGVSYNQKEQPGDTIVWCCLYELIATPQYY